MGKQNSHLLSDIIKALLLVSIQIILTILLFLIEESVSISGVYFNRWIRLKDSLYMVMPTIINYLFFKHLFEEKDYKQKRNVAIFAVAVLIVVTPLWYLCFRYVPGTLFHGDILFLFLELALNIFIRCGLIEYPIIAIWNVVKYMIMQRKSIRKT